MPKINFFSLNTMGIPFSPHRKTRFKLICDFINKTKPSFVMLQEVGDLFAFNYFKNNLGKYYIYPNKIHGLINNHGAMILLCKFPLINYSFVKYKISNGPSFPFSLVERLSQKGIQIGEAFIHSKKITIINTHLVASFFNDPKEYTYMHLQLQELINFIKKIYV